MKRLELLKNQKTNGDGGVVLFPGGRLHLVASGIFDKAKVKYQVSYDGGNSFHDYLSGGEQVFIQSAVGKGFYVIEDGPVQIRASLSDSSANTDVSIVGYYNQYYSPEHNLIGPS